MKEELKLDIDKKDDFKIAFYGAGIKDEQLAKPIERVLTQLFGKREILFLVQSVRR